MKLALLGLIGVLVVGVISFGEKLSGVSFGASLSFVASVALLGVTWVYVQSTRRLVTAQEAQLAYQQRAAHFAAASQMWSLGFKTNNTLQHYALRLSAPFEPDLTIDERIVRSEKIGAGSNKLEKHADKLVRLIADVDDPLEELAWEAATGLIGTATALMHLSSLTLVECTRALTAGEEFDARRVMDSWENPTDPGAAQKVRWSEITSASAFEEIGEVMSRLISGSRRELRDRTSVL